MSKEIFRSAVRAVLAFGLVGAVVAQALLEQEINQGVAALAGAAVTFYFTTE